MKNPRTIILAVVCAKNDYANQIILDHCRKIDDQGRRTIGIITKPDFLRKETDNELAWIKLAQNKDIYLERGWHMLKNREDHQTHYSFEERNADKSISFSKGQYADLPRERVGIASLCERLSMVLLNHLIKELPFLKEEVINKLHGTLAEIEKLGEKCDTIQDQRTVLMKISMRIHDVLKSAIKGYYESSFFGPVDMDAAVDSSENICRFRAVVQHLNIKFAKDMRLRGHKYAFGIRPGDQVQDNEEDTTTHGGLGDDLDMAVLPKPKLLTRQAAIGWVKKALERFRGFELPDTFQPLLISQLFWEHSQPWELIASEHINTIASACKEFVNNVLQDSAPAELVRRIAALSVDSALDLALKNAKAAMQKVVKDKNRHPATYNHYFTTTIQKMRRLKHHQITKQSSKVAEVETCDFEGETQIYVDLDKLIEAMDEVIELDIDVFSSKEALDIERIYYKDEIKYFVIAVAKAVVERHLVEPLPDIILSPLVVTQMTEKEIEFVAAEPPEITQQRAHLESRKDMLEKGLDTFREAMGGLKRRSIPG